MARMNDADIAAEKHLEIEKANGRRDFSANLLLAVILSFALLCGGLLVLVLPQNSFSEQENRVLQTTPSFSFEKLADGRYTSEISVFYSDQFPARDFFVGLKSISELSLLKLENNDCLLCKNGYLAEKFKYGDTQYDNLEVNISAIKDYTAATELPMTVVILPRAVDVLGDKLPPIFNSKRTDTVWAKLDSSGLEYLNLRDMYASRLADGEEVWYRTDHHYTTLGAYYAYAALGESLGYEPLPLSYFTQEAASADFLGTTYSKSGIKTIKPDSMYYFRFPGDEAYTIYYDGSQRSINGFYDRSFLTQKDKYSSFLGGNYGLLTVKKNATGESGSRKTLLMIKDSFAHSVAPFLAIHFDLEIVDTRYYKGSVKELSESSGASATLVFVGLDTLATSDSLKVLRYKLQPVNP